MNDISKAYNSTSLKANYLISTGLSNAGAIFCNYGSQNRYTHGKSIAAYETIETSATTMSPWAASTAGSSAHGYTGQGATCFRGCRTSSNTPTPCRPSASPTRCSWWPAATKRCSTVPRPILMKKDYPAALADMNMWAQNQLTASYYKELTEESINKWQMPWATT